MRIKKVDVNWKDTEGGSPNLELEIDRLPVRNQIEYRQVHLPVPDPEPIRAPDGSTILVPPKEAPGSRGSYLYGVHPSGYVSLFRVPGRDERREPDFVQTLAMADGGLQKFQELWPFYSAAGQLGLPHAVEVWVKEEGKDYRSPAAVTLELAQRMVSRVDGLALKLNENSYYMPVRVR
ncbi:MAG: hypothetical protein HY735_13075 [Verrucomicrobia bacterium]|nr:hypothetical protein [Verrucomicrobiota bacterium]